MMQHTKKFAFLVAAAIAFGGTALGQVAGTDTVTVSGTAPAPTVTAVLMTDVATPLDFGATYAIGQLNSSTFAYGANFLIQTTFSNVTTSVGIAISGSQANYVLAYRHTPAGGTLTSDVAFGTIGTVTTSGAATATYAKGITTTAYNALSTVSTEATRFAIGAKSTTAASVNLSTTVTVTVTVQ